MDAARLVRAGMAGSSSPRRSAGSASPTPIVQYRHWGISAVMRVETARRPLLVQGRVRATSATEPSVTAFIAELSPGATARRCRHRSRRKVGCCSRILPGDVMPDAHGHRAAFEHLVQPQSITRRPRAGPARRRMRARRPLIEIPGEFANVLDDPMLGEWLLVDSASRGADRRLARRRRGTGRAARAPRCARARRLPSRQRQAGRRPARSE